MDNNEGNFIVISDEKFAEQMQAKDPQVFKVGEIIEVRGSRLRIEKIQKNKLILKLLPQQAKLKKF